MSVTLTKKEVTALLEIHIDELKDLVSRPQSLSGIRASKDEIESKLMRIKELVEQLPDVSDPTERVTF